MPPSFSKILPFLFLTVTACTHLEDEITDTQVFTASRARVWEALIQAFNSYKLQISNEETGLIKTELIVGPAVWTPAHDKNKNTSGINYHITAQLIYERPYATVTIRKNMKRKKGFLSSSQTIPSDFLEEQILFYRLERELYIKRLIKKYGQ